MELEDAAHGFRGEALAQAGLICFDRGSRVLEAVGQVAQDFPFFGGFGVVGCGGVGWGEVEEELGLLVDFWARDMSVRQMV